MFLFSRQASKCTYFLPSSHDVGLADVPGRPPGQLAHGQSQGRRGGAGGGGGAGPHSACVGQPGHGLELWPAGISSDQWSVLTRFRPPDKPNSAVLVRVGSREHLRDILVTNLREWPIQTPESLPGYCHSDCLSHSDWRLSTVPPENTILPWLADSSWWSRSPPLSGTAPAPCISWLCTCQKRV